MKVSLYISALITALATQTSAYDCWKNTDDAGRWADVKNPADRLVDLCKQGNGEHCYQADKGKMVCLPSNLTVDPANVVQALVNTLVDVFDATRDLYQTLKSKQRRDYEQNLRSRGYRRSIDYVDDGPDGEEEIVMDKAAVRRVFDNGLQDVGSQFALGDVISQAGLQSQIITLQSAIITTFLYGPTSPEPLSHHLKTLLEASREAGTTAVDILTAQLQRQIAVLPPTPRSTARSRAGSMKAPPYPVTATSSASTALIKSRHDPPEDYLRSVHPAKTTILSRPPVPRTDTESTAYSGPTAYGTETTLHSNFCLYALDLQRHASQPLASSITSDPSPFCPYCKRSLHLSPGRSWEIFKDDGVRERCFHVQNRFVVKCHREGVDGGYSCVLCAQSDSHETVCGDVKALVKHVWQDHDIGELEAELDVAELVEKMPERRSDSVMAPSSRRSFSLGPSRGGRRRLEREVETLEIRAPRRDSAPRRDRD
ncbi:uncharacterized protein N0V89_003350 [Didymosphaeria variabile]|uniref:Uncharacterized protein n=1 Tax=Didymosphaeria variabile TaxID=1932322 RepID=A0A9W8XU96_9PLEO|nr:uncharacterized protein N0V89_003350 [Didymosphaeria variabile]KAJ4358766.1 hypothetical protein N0V89_003350 [Didymosphaeria variabile]